MLIDWLYFNILLKDAYILLICGHTRRHLVVLHINLLTFAYVLIFCLYFAYIMLIFPQ